MVYILLFLLAFLKDHNHPSPVPLTVVKSLGLELEGAGSKVVHMQLKAPFLRIEALQNGRGAVASLSLSTTKHRFLLRAPCILTAACRVPAPGRPWG